MQRYFFELAYDGTDFFGWQRQPREISVQQLIEDALSKLHSNTAISVVGCGRTDTGVHAHRYHLHVDLPEIEQEEVFLFKLNRMLPNSIVIFSITPVEQDQHARFDATQRTYRYFIHQEKNPFKQRFSWYYPHALDFDKMNEAANHLLGKKDFTSLSKLHTDVKTNICEVSEARWIVAEREIYFQISADRFLRNMVRATVGTLLDVGQGKIEPEKIKEILEAKDRQAASTSVPAHGLFLWEINY